MWTLNASNILNYSRKVKVNPWRLFRTKSLREFSKYMNKQILKHQNLPFIENFDSSFLKNKY